MKIIGFLLIIGILFSYVPVFPMDECPEGKHMGNMKMDCGYNFHNHFFTSKREMALGRTAKPLGG